CPLCRKNNIKFIISTFARRIISLLNVKCAYNCDYNNLNGYNIDKHKLKCVNKLYKCSIDNKCNFMDNKILYTKHIIDKHNEIITQSFDFYNKNKNYDFGK